MLLRLTRSLTNISQRSNFGVTQQEKLTKNMQILNDEMNYTLNRVNRVIRAYYFLGSSSNTVKWDEESEILQSVIKVNRLVKHLDPESVNTLIVNIGFLRLWSNEIWNELELAFLRKSFKFLAPNNVPNISASFQGAQRKNTEIWNILEEILMNEVYSSRLLEIKQCAYTFRSFALINQGSDLLYSKFHENLKSELKDISIASLIDILKGAQARKLFDSELIDQLLVKGLELIPKSSNNSYENLLRFSLLLDGSDERIHEIENNYLQNLSLENIFKQSRAVTYYLSENFKPTAHRKEFVQKMFENLIKNEGKLMAFEKSESKRIFYKATLTYAPFKLGASVPDTELLSTFNLIGGKNEYLNEKLKGIHLEVKEYLKGKNLI